MAKAKKSGTKGAAKSPHKGRGKVDGGNADDPTPTMKQPQVERGEVGQYTGEGQPALQKQ